MTLNIVRFVKWILEKTTIGTKQKRRKKFGKLKTFKLHQLIFFSISKKKFESNRPVQIL